MTIAILISGILLGGEPASAPAEGAILGVSNTFNNVPFRYRMEPSARRPGYRLFRLTYPSPVKTEHEPNNTIPADYYLPEEIAPNSPRRPAVICTHILDGNFVLAEMICSHLAGRGIPAIMLKLPYYGERSLPGGPEAIAANPQRFVGALDQAIQDVRRTIDLLASRPEVDPQQIGVTGISLGGIVSATAAGAEPRLNRAVLMMAGGDLLRIIHHARETAPLSKLIEGLPAQQRAELEAKIRSVDPLRFAAGLGRLAQQGKVLMINAAEDEVIPRPCTEKLAAAIGMSDRVIWLQGLGHYTALAELPAALRTTGDFFARDLPEGVQPRLRSRGSAAFETVVALIGQLAALLGADPAPGRCHVVDLNASITPEGEKTIEIPLRLIRGSAGRIRLETDLPPTGPVSLGQGRYPWMASGEDTVIAGTGKAAERLRDPRTMAGAENFTRLRMAAGALGSLVISPDVLRRWLAIEESARRGGRRAIRISVAGQSPGVVLLVFRQDGKTPKLAEFDLAGTRGTVRFRQWQIGAAADDAMFEPPEKAARQEIDQATLYQLIATLLKLAG